MTAALEEWERMPPSAAPEGLTVYNDESLAVKAWNLSGGGEWDGLAIVAETLGITDVERLMHQLAAIRNYQNRPSE